MLVTSTTMQNISLMHVHKRLHIALLHSKVNRKGWRWVPTGSQSHFYHCMIKRPLPPRSERTTIDCLLVSPGEENCRLITLPWPTVERMDYIQRLGMVAYPPLTVVVDLYGSDGKTRGGKYSLRCYASTSKDTVNEPVTTLYYRNGDQKPTLMGAVLLISEDRDLCLIDWDRLCK